MKSSVATSSYGTYRRAYNSLKTFFNELYGVDPGWPLTIEEAVLFVTFLHQEDYAAATIHTYLSAVNHINFKLKKGQNLMADPLVRKVLDGVDKMKVPRPLRSPITFELLQELVLSIDHIIKDTYNIALYRSLFLSMFFMCTRIGEVAISQGQQNHILQYDSIKWVDSGKRTEHIMVTFSSFKHSKGSSQHTIPVRRVQGLFDPIYHMKVYLAQRGSSPGPLFRSASGECLTSFQVNKILKKALLWAKVSPSDFGTHSFRIGRCTELAKQGASYSEIRFLGRFHSNAFLKYIRPQEFKQ